MTRYSKSNGKYKISGSSYQMLIGTRAQVWHGTAYKTSGGLKKSNLMQNKAGRIVSKAKHSTAKREKRLVKHGYGTKKGVFGFVKMGSSKSKKMSKKMKGGMPYGNSYSPAGVMANGIDGQGVTNYGYSSTNVQMAAGMAGGRKSRKMSMKGGKGYGWLASNGIDGQGVTNYGSNSTNVQLAAGMAGGRRRKRGGTTKPFNNSMSWSPLNQALNAAS